MTPPGKSPRRKSHAIKDAVSSTMDKGWPPSWSVSFSDMTTLLMTAFILVYALTAKKIPKEFLSMTEQQRITPEAIEYLMKIKMMKGNPEIVVAMLKHMTPGQSTAIKEAKGMRRLEEKLKQRLSETGMADMAEVVGTGSGKGAADAAGTEGAFDTVMVTPRTPLLFAEGDARLRPEGTKLLERIAQLLKEIPYSQVRVEGHTDTKPMSPFRRYQYHSNWELSSARAISVARYFISKGIPAERIGVAGYGKEKPKCPNDTEENMAKNRRVEIYISFEKQEEDASLPSPAGASR